MIGLFIKKKHIICVLKKCECESVLNRRKGGINAASVSVWFICNSYDSSQRKMWQNAKWAVFNLIEKNKYGRSNESIVIQQEYNLNDKIYQYFLSITSS